MARKPLPSTVPARDAHHQAGINLLDRLLEAIAEIAHEKSAEKGVAGGTTWMNLICSAVA